MRYSRLKISFTNKSKLEWMLPNEHYHHTLEWDDEMCVNSKETSEFERLLKFSTERKLDATEEAYLKEAIKVFT